MSLPQQLSRRRFLGGLAAASAPFVARAAPQDTPPNVLLVICDQMRGDAMSFLGNPNARTPNLDRLAAGGVCFDNAFCDNPVCMPSRKSMFSGLYPHQHGTWTNGHGQLLDLPGTMLDYFRRAGYRVGYVGKNHTYQKAAIQSMDFARVRDREPFREYNRWVPPHWHGDTYWPAERCYAWRNTDDAVEFLKDGNGRDPFFLTVSYFDPHPPYMAPPEFTSRYSSKDMKIPAYVPPSALSERLQEYAQAMGLDKLSDADLTETMRYYYAAIEGGVDHQVGRLMSALENGKLLDNTIIVFVSDHGDFMGTHRMVRKGMFLYDALLHVPMIWRVPGLKQRGRRTKALAQGIDIFPTLVELTGRTSAPERRGRSLKPLLFGEESPAEQTRAVFTSAGYGEVAKELLSDGPTLPKEGQKPLHTRVMDQGVSPQHKISMIRTREWKFILNETRPPELYRMNDGWVERENVAGRPEFAAVRRQMEERLAGWWRW